MHLLQLAIPLLLVMTQQGQTPRFVPGQAMARFVPGSAGSEAVLRAGRESPPDLGALAPVVENLGSRVGIPLQTSQISSGGWFVLSIDLEAIAGRSLQQLGDRDRVVDARLNEQEAGEVGKVPDLGVIIIKFASGSPELKAVVQAREGATDEPLAELLESLAQELAVPLAGEATSQDELLLQIDVEALTLRTVERLQALEEIESAQPNYIVKAFGRGP